MAVTFDAVGPNVAGAAQSLAVASPLTWSHTFSGANRFGVIGVICGIVQGAPHNLGNEDNDFVITSVTVGGLPCFRIGTVLHSNELQGFKTGYVALYAIVNPPVGVQTVNVNYTIANQKAGDAIEGGSLSFNGVDQFSPYRLFSRASGLSVLPSVTLPSAINNMVCDVVGCGSAIASSTQTNRWLQNFSSSSSAGCAAMSTANGAANVVMSYNVASDNWAILSIDIQAVGVKRSGLTMGIDNI